MEINEYQLKLSHRKFNLPKPLEIGKRYQASMEIDVYAQEDNEMETQDGTVNRIFKARSTGDMEILSKGFKIIKASGKNKKSRALHGAIWYYHNERGLVEDFDNYYDAIMGKIILYLPEIIKFLENKT